MFSVTIPASLKMMPRGWWIACLVLSSLVRDARALSAPPRRSVLRLRDPSELDRAAAALGVAKPWNAPKVDSGRTRKGRRETRHHRAGGISTRGSRITYNRPSPFTITAAPSHTKNTTARRPFIITAAPSRTKIRASSLDG